MHLQAIYHHSIIISFVIYTDDWVPVGYEHDILRSTWYTESSTILCCTGVTTAVCNTTSVNIYLVRVYRIQHCSCCCFRCCRCCGEKWNEKLKRENYETKQNTYENLPSHVGFGTWYRTWNGNVWYRKIILSVSSTEFERVFSAKIERHSRQVVVEHRKEKHIKEGHHECWRWCTRGEAYQAHCTESEYGLVTGCGGPNCSRTFFDVYDMC